MKKRLLALLIAVICISITAVGSFAYTPNEYPTLKYLYPDDVKFYGYKPNLNASQTPFNSYKYEDGHPFYCPSCGWWIVGWEVPLESYVEDDVMYFENNNGLMFIGNYNNPNAFSVSGYLSTTNLDGSPRQYYSNSFECCVTRGEDIYKNLDVAMFYDEYDKLMVYTHVNPLEDWTPVTSVSYQALLIKENTSTYYNSSYYYNNQSFDINNRNDYVNYNNRVINFDPFTYLYADGSSSEGYDEGYDEGYSQGFGDGRSEGYQTGYNTGVIDGQGSIDALDIVFEGIFTGLGGFFAPILSLGIGNLTIALLVGFVATFSLVMLIIKIIRG